MSVIIIKRLCQTLASGWVFTFRWPTLRFSQFIPNGILLFPFYQTAIFVLCGITLKPLLPLHIPIGPWFIAIFLSSALTGFLHEDGWADAFDSLGVSRFSDSPENLAKIRQAFKDPRLGSFGVTALILLWLMRFSILNQPQMNWQIALSVFLLSRTLPLSVSIFESRNWQAHPDSRSSHLLATINPSLALSAGIFAILGSLALFLPDRFAFDFALLTFLGKVFATLAIAWSLLKWQSWRAQTLNGDMIGATICLTELFLWMTL